jgi:hypothetical protein
MSMSNTYFAIRVGAVALLITDAASAFCSTPTPKVCSAYFQADVVLRGEVLSEHRGEERITYKVKVDKTFKGKSLPLRYVYTGNDSGRLPLNVGSRYVLFADQKHDGLTIGCNEQDLSEPVKVDVVSAEIERLQVSKTQFATIEGEVLAADYLSPLPGQSVTALVPVLRTDFSFG